MCKLVVLEWFKLQRDLGVTKGFTISQVYKALKGTPNARCLETVWSQIVRLREKGVLVSEWSIPVKYKLNDKGIEEVDA